LTKLGVEGIHACLSHCNTEEEEEEEEEGIWGLLCEKEWFMRIIGNFEVQVMPQITLILFQLNPMKIKISERGYKLGAFGFIIGI